MPSSLQRALAQGKPAPPAEARKKSTGFEAIFGGLDFSELGASGAVAGPSHSAQLLKEKQQQVALKAIQEKEDAKMEAIVQNRIAALKSKAPKASGGLVGALVGMHDRDRCVVEGRTMKKQRPKSSDARSGRKGKNVAKKNQRRKF